MNNVIYAFPLLDDDFVIHEILTRLPVKTLMRFKSICTTWMSTIQHDPHFHQLHYNHSPLSLFIHKDDSIQSHSQYFLSVEEGAGATSAAKEEEESGISAPRAAVATFHTLRKRRNFFYDKFLQPVNGLACLTRRKSVRICNPSTRQETQWIPTTLKRTPDSTTKVRPLASFGFGFDTVSKKHKVVAHRCLDSRLPPKYAYEVFTVGVDMSWRRIDNDDQVPLYTLDNYGCGYINGAIYWMEKRKRDKFGHWLPTVLVKFDLGTEKFREIPIPDFIIDFPSKCHGGAIDLLELDGRVALSRRVRNKNIVSMWRLTYEDEADHNKNCWSEVVMALPFYWDDLQEENHIGFKTISGSTCHIMVTVSKLVINVRELSVYICNWRNNAVTKIELGDLLSTLKGLPEYHCRRSLPFTESLFPSYPLPTIPSIMLHCLALIQSVL